MEKTNKGKQSKRSRLKLMNYSSGNYTHQYTKKQLKNNRRDSLNNLLIDGKQVKAMEQIINKSVEELENKIQDKSEIVCETYQNDFILNQLVCLQKAAKSYELKNAEQKLNTLIGKRILIIEIEKQKLNFMNKKEKKQKIQQDFFRFKRIQKYGFEKLIEDKIKQNTYIAVPDQTGKGYIQSTVQYNDLNQNHQKNLTTCSYLDVVKCVNKIFTNNFSHGSRQSQREPSNTKLTNISYFLAIVFVIFTISMIQLPEYSFIIYGAMGIFVILLLVICLILYTEHKNYINKNNHHEQSIQQIQEYFNRLNTENVDENFIWKFSQDKMYFEVKFMKEAKTIIKKFHKTSHQSTSEYIKCMSVNQNIQ